MPAIKVEMPAKMPDMRYQIGTLNKYRDRLKGMQILLGRTQAGSGKTGKQEQEQTSRNHVQAF